jgi:hypothetical protein
MMAESVPTSQFHECFFASGIFQRLFCIEFAATISRQAAGWRSVAKFTTSGKEVEIFCSKGETGIVATVL